jgi:hypothetical protein
MPNNDSLKLDELLILTAVIKEQTSELKHDVQQLNQYVFKGNGKPSLIARVEVTESLLAELTWFRRAAIAGFCTSVVSVGILIISAVV